MGGRGGGSGKGGGAGGGARSTVSEYAPGWDLDNFQKVVTQEIHDKNKINLKIRKENIDDDIKKLKGNIEELSQGTKEDIKHISSYQRTIDRLQKIKKQIEYGESFF